MVEWTSAAGVFTSFQERGQKTSDNTSITISPLTPSTKYVFQVAMVTQEGQGAEVRTVVTTEEEVGGTISLLSTVQYGHYIYVLFLTIDLIATVSLFILCSIYSADKLAYFQIRILGISDCEEWQVSDISASAAAMIH